MSIATVRSKEEQAAVSALLAAEGYPEEEILRDQLESHLKTGVSQADVAKAIGVSASAVNMFLKGTYRNPKKIIELLKGYFKTLERQAGEVVLPELAETSVYKEVTSIVEYVHSQYDFGVIYGPAGIGKTTALNAYREVIPQAIFITADQTIGASKALLEEILYTINRPESGSTRRMMKTIVEVLKESGRILIIDEAQHLTYRALETLRAIYDKCKIAVLLAGNESIYGNMTGRSAAAYAQLYSRVGIRRSLTGKITLADIEALLGEELDKDSLAFLHRVSLEPGGIRVAMKLYKLGKIAAEGNPVTIDHLRSAQGFMMQSRAAI